MKAFFTTCSQAIEKAVNEKSFGLYFSEIAKPNQNIHVHDCCEVFLSLSEGGSFLIDGKVYRISKNCLFLINNFQTHKVTPIIGQKFVRYSLHIHSKFLQENSTAQISLYKHFYSQNKINIIQLTQNESDKMVELLNSLSIDYGYADDIYKKLRVIEILLETIKLCQISNSERINDDKKTPIDSALEYIDQNFTKQLSLKDIAKNSFLSVTTLCALFRQHLSTTVIKYLTGKRISFAKKLLSEGKSVTETAFESGFNDYANFIRTFKKSVGVPPGKYRTDKCH